MAFLRRTIEIERILRGIADKAGFDFPPKISPTRIAKELAAKGILSMDILERFLAIWDIRNRTAHGYEMPTSITRQSLEVAVAFLHTLERLSDELAARRQGP